MDKPEKTEKKLSPTTIFVNREQPLNLFKKTVIGIPKDKLELLVFYGVGGQGKTALRNQFELTLKDQKFPEVYISVLDFYKRGIIDPDLALLLIRNNLAESGKVTFPSFDQAFCIYWKKTYPERQEPVLVNNWLEESIGLISESTTGH